jgi:nitrogen fixation protein FixH
MSLDAMQQTPPKRSGFMGWLVGSNGWIPLLFVAGFLILFAVTGNFVRLALSTFPGLVTTNAYERGLAYDDVIAAEQAQAEQGWQMQIIAPEFSGEGQMAAVALTDRYGEPLAGGTVIMMAERMTRYAQQVRTPLTDVGGGRYEAPVAFPISGRWFVSVLADVDGARHFATQEVFVHAPGVN